MSKGYIFTPKEIARFEYTRITRKDINNEELTKAEIDFVIFIEQDFIE
ncbi:hypothetical protein LCGC14_0267510 [marine sediment metagenome]|uniref:Uncharacterized protein n=1 Tax=marine sediment metagenome TaxID=412755 RepID=A0A0F9U016_9ZZZZ